MKLIKLKIPKSSDVKSIFTGTNSNHLNLLVKEATANGLVETNQIAYVLATAKHETDNFNSLFEYGKKGVDQVTYFNNKYSSRTDLGNTPGTNDGYDYRGRGYAHITGKVNYKKMTDIFGDELKVDFVKNPDLIATNLDYAAKTTAYGMANGSFTGARLSTYINDTKTSYIEARWVINGKDQRDLIAKYAEELDAALEKMLQNTDIPLTMDARTEKTAVTMIGGKAGDVIYGGSGNDSLNGGNGKDQIDGGLGKDTIYGGAGADLLKAGVESGVSDTFIYKDLSDSTKANHDNINNFETGIDKINLMGLGFNALKTNSGPTEIGELRFNANALISDQVDFRIDFYAPPAGQLVFAASTDFLWG